MILVFDKPQELTDIDNAVEAAMGNIQSWQAVELENNGKYSNLQDISTLFDFPPNVGRIVAYIAEASGYFIILHGETPPTEYIYTNGNWDILTDGVAALWQKIVDSQEDIEDWAPLNV